MNVTNGVWYVAGLTAAGITWWAAVAYCEKRAAQAATDGVENWEDIYWARMLRRLSRSRFADLKRRMENDNGDPED